MEFLEEEGTGVNLFKFRHLDDVFEKEKSPKHSTKVKKEATYRYKFKNEEEEKVVESMFCGGVDLLDIPKIPPKTVKLYVTSGLPDFDFERNVLMEHVYPSIRQYCRDRHGIDFQVVDLRWGMENVPETFKPSVGACLKELKHCQARSMGPSFMCLMGQKYRTFVPTEEIDKLEFETILVQLAEEGREDDAILVDKAYKEDTNSTPTVYRLQRPTDTSEEIQTTWREDMHVVNGILAAGADACFQQGTLGSDACVRFRQSQIEREIEVGVLDLNANERKDFCILFTRSFTDLDHLKNSSNQEHFLDTPPNGKDDLEAERMLTHLRKVMTDNLSRRNVVESEVLWSKDLENDSKYVEKLKRSVFCTVKTLVDDFMNGRCSLYDEDLFHEVYQHWDIVKQSSRVYIERDDLLSSVKQYLLTDSDQPFVICGVKGSGKTATISKIVHDVNVAVLNNDLNMRTAIIFRFIGQTQKSQTAQQLLHSLCHQLCHIMGKYRHAVPTDYKSLKLFFLDLVQRGEFGGMLIILLDSLERISTSENGHKLEWLPSRIAQNVKIIVTADYAAADLVKLLQHKCEDSIAAIPPFVSLECENIMKVMMNTNKISVNYNQWSAIREVFQSCRLPIFIHLSLEDVKLWRSYDTPTENQLGRSVEEVVEKILVRTEKNHGSILVTHVLGYLAASNNGLSESELLDILSLDDVVLDNIFTSMQSKIRRFPPALLVQILQEIDVHIAEMETDGILVLRWRHSQFDEIARKRYLSNGELTRYLFFNMADYYLGTWGGSTQKPYTDKIDRKEKKACRYVPEQPFVFGTCDIDKRYNLRKMTLLPLCLLNSFRYDELRSEVFCNYFFLYNRIQATSLQQLLTDFDVFNDRECNLVAEALRMSGSAILLDIRSLVIELIGRLLPLSENYKFIKQLVHQCDLDVQRNCPLVPNVQCYSAPGGPLQSEGDTGSTQYCPVDVGVFKSSDGILLTAKPFYSTRVRVWELSRGDPRPDMMMPVGQIHHSRDGNFLVVFQENKLVKVFRSDCGDLIGDIQYGFGVPSHIEVSKKYLAFTIEKGCSPFVIELEDSHIVHKFGYHSSAVAINQSDTYLACNSGKSVILFELPLMQRRCVVETSEVPKDIIFISSKLKCFVSTKGKTIESIVFDVVNKRSKVNKILTDLEIRNCILSNSEALFLVQSGRCLYVIDSVTDIIMKKLTDLPYGIDVDPATTFTGAGFSADDSKIVAPRANFLAIWDVSTGCPLRVLQSSACPIKSVFTSDVVNKAVTILDDGTFQVWNLDNIDTDILHSNNIFPSKIEKVSLSTERGIALAYSDQSSEAKIINFGDGFVKDIIQHSDEDEQLQNMLLSKDGRFAITCAKGKCDLQPSTLLEDHVLWDVDTGIRLLHSNDIRYAMFSDKGNFALFLKCVEFHKQEWNKNIYNVIQIGLPDGQDVHLDFPDNTEFVSSPRTVTQNTINYLVFIGQTNRRTYDHESKQELANWIEIRLFVRNLSSRSTEMDRIRIQNLVDGADDKTQFLETFPTYDEKLLILYGRNIDYFDYKPDKGLVIPEIIMKGAILYDIEREECLRHIPGIFRPDSLVSSLLISKSLSVVLDGNMNVFSGESYRNVHFIDTEFSSGNFRLALDGKYIIGLLSNKREIVVVRTTDGKNIGHVYVHGIASCLEVGDDDRTVLVGCEDGRIMILTLILETSDPVTDIIMKFPSRSGQSLNMTNMDMRDSLIRSDLHHMRCRTPDTSRLSARSRRRSSSGRRTPDHQTISTIVRLTRRNSQNRSEACCIQ